jgi:hypothetical protein
MNGTESQDFVFVRIVCLKFLADCFEPIYPQHQELMMSVVSHGS